MEDTGERLEREVEILTSTRNHLAAPGTALKDVLELVQFSGAELFIFLDHRI